MKIETTRLAHLAMNRFRRAPSQTGQAAFTASGFPSKAVRGHLLAVPFDPTVYEVPALPCIRLTAPWTAALRPVRGFPALRLLQRLCHQHKRSVPLPLSLTASCVGFPGSVITLYPT